MTAYTRPLAIVTGASAGIGDELTPGGVEQGFDVLIAADQPAIHDAAPDFRPLGATVEPIEADLATLDGVDRLYAATTGRPVDALLAYAGHGLGHGFLDQHFDAVRHVIETNITGPFSLIQHVGREMRARSGTHSCHPYASGPNCCGCRDGSPSCRGVPGETIAGAISAGALHRRPSLLPGDRPSAASPPGVPHWASRWRRLAPSAQPVFRKGARP